MREPWKSRTILLAAREGCERTERERAWEDLVTGRAGTTAPNPPFARGGKRRNEIGMKAQLVQDQLFTSPPFGYPVVAANENRHSSLADSRRHVKLGEQGTVSNLHDIQGVPIIIRGQFQ
jgi:hypothetical protein